MIVLLPQVFYCQFRQALHIGKNASVYYFGVARRVAWRGVTLDTANVCWTLMQSWHLDEFTIIAPFSFNLDRAYSVHCRAEEEIKADLQP